MVVVLVVVEVEARRDEAEAAVAATFAVEEDMVGCDRAVWVKEMAGTLVGHYCTAIALLATQSTNRNALSCRFNVQHCTNFLQRLPCCLENRTNAVELSKIQRNVTKWGLRIIFLNERVH